MADVKEPKRDQKVVLACACHVNGELKEKGDTVDLTAGEKAVFESHGWIEKEGEK